LENMTGSHFSVIKFIQFLQNNWPQRASALQTPQTGQEKCKHQHHFLMTERQRNHHLSLPFQALMI
ncbi:hypothetical protein KU397_24610, partial [Salmonella enterica subsp. enterica serovar Kentucky]|nr:hypothetical protein [Salmonella enterica subsp. enterica serovar Kentucky]